MYISVRNNMNDAFNLLLSFIRLVPSFGDNYTNSYFKLSNNIIKVLDTS